MKIFAIDCTAAPASAAIVEDGKTLSYAYSNVGLTHSQTLVPMISNVLSNIGIGLEDIDYFAINAGPGSFTGVRIGVAALKGLDFNNDSNCVPVSTLESMAYNYVGVSDVIVCSAMDARCQQVYTACFDVTGDSVTRLTEDMAIPLSVLMENLKAYDKPVVFVGDGAELCYNYSKQDGELPECSFSLAPSALRYQNAVSAALCAQQQIADGFAPIPSEKVLPKYLRAPQAERELKKKKSKEA